MEDIMSKDPTQKVFNYITTLEDTNEELLKTLKYSVAVLTQIKPSAPNPQRWQEMLDTFQETIKVGERIVGEKTPG
jgi:glutaminase